MKKTEFNIEISIENVCAFLDIHRDHEMYEEMVEELKEMLPQAYEKIRPLALLEFGDLDGYSVEAEQKPVREALYGVYSIGREMSEWSTRLFQEGNYLGGMLADAIADDYLFQMDREMEETVIGLCKEKEKGIVGRAEAPQDIPMSIQKKAYDVTGAGEEGIDIKPSFMYDPVKTVCQVYLLDDNKERYRPEHDCSNCSNLTCKRRKIPSVTITVRTKEGEQKILARKSENLLAILQEHQVFLSAVCAGRGTCGKCRVRFLKGSQPASDADRKFFTGEELKEGWRLACRTFPQNDCTITLENEEKGFFVLAEEEKPSAAVTENGSYGIAVDIGTTTIAMQLVDLDTGTVADTYTTINKQRAYGADVISRIEASNDGKKEELKKSIRTDLKEGLLALTQEGSIRVQRMVIGANSTMVHLLMGYSCETLGVFPFTPVNISTIHTESEALFGTDVAKFEVIVCPGISTYVGGDITAGLYALGFEEKSRPCVLIDLGTNGEMAIGAGEDILVTSTAAGPAFEGGNIVCGTGSIPGAVCSVTLEQGDVRIKTIGDRPPAGICGTGVIDMVYELKKEEIIDETGLMEEPYFEEGFEVAEEGKIRFYQKDVREIQLAKSAVRAGLETLISKYGIRYDEIEKIYIAGGFGYKMDIRKAVDIGLFPAECEGKIEAVGNSCLKGAVKYLLDGNACQVVERIAEQAREINLSSDKEFQEFYMEHMYFE